jgi:hypothetical protein
VAAITAWSLEVNTRFLYAMAGMSLDGVGGDAETFRHGCRAKSLGQQPEDFQLPGCELRFAPLPVPLLLIVAAAPGDTPTWR